MNLIRSRPKNRALQYPTLQVLAKRANKVVIRASPHQRITQTQDRRSLWEMWSPTNWMLLWILAAAEYALPCSGSVDMGQWCPPQCDCFNYYETVDCSRRGLIEVPSMSVITRRLYLEGNQLEDFPVGALRGAGNLSVLIMENNRIVSLKTDSFCGLEHLQELDVSTNQISTFHVVTSGNTNATGCRAPSLKEINLSHNLMRTIPLNLSEFAPNLEILNLGYNEISSARLDPSYANMTNLRYLDLSRNDIRKIMARDLDAIRQIPVETINFSDCGLVYIEESAFAGMNVLSSLTLARSLVNHTVLEKVFQKFQPDNQMSRLDVSETYITNLTVAMIGNFRHLVSLFVSYCDLEFIEPDLFYHLLDLETLHIEGGRLLSLENISSLKKLRRLSAHMNQLYKIDMSGLNSLESIDLSYNQFEKLPVGWIGGSEDIQMLNVSHNKIVSVSSDSFLQTSAISTLDISYNILSTFPNFGSLKLSKLDISHNSLTSVEDGAFDILHQTLTELDMSYNAFTQFSNHVFRDFHLLQFLGLSHNRLGGAFKTSKLGNLFESLQLVQVLDISYNGISVMHEQDLLPLHHLNTLYLHGNQIHDVRDVSLDSTRVLAKLVMSGNQLHVIDVDVLTRLEYLEEIDVSDNPFECTCSLVPFLQWANTTMATVLAVREHSAYLCDFPPDAAGKPIFGRRIYPEECHEETDGSSEQRLETGNTIRIGNGKGNRRSDKEVRKVVIMTLIVICSLISVGCFVIVCYVGQVCQRVKSLRYRWQIRYREVSAVETGVNDLKV